MTPFKKLLLAGLLVATMVPAVSAEHLVIAAVNDTHSQIDPALTGKAGCFVVVPSTTKSAKKTKTR